MTLRLGEETAALDGIPLHYAHAGSGPAVVLLHGFPATWQGWRSTIDALADDHHVVAPDLRGIGVDHAPGHGFDKVTMAGDVAALLDHLGVERAAVVGHDIGALVALTFAREHPDRTSHLVFLDQGVPGHGLLEFVLDLREPGHGFWHFAFHMAPDMPERLIRGREAGYFTLFWDEQAVHREAIPVGERRDTVAAYQRPGALDAGLGWYRALRQDAAYFAGGTPPLRMPVLALGGVSPVLEEPDAQETALTVALAAQDRHGDGVGIAQQLDRPLLQQRPGRGQLHPAGVPFEPSGSASPLQRDDRGTDSAGPGRHHDPRGVPGDRDKTRS